jgi:hypothetical protein
MPNFTFELSSFEITDTRSQHKDTDWAVFGVRIGSRSSHFVHKQLGDVNNGVYQLGMFVQDVPVGVSESVLINYIILNAGRAKTPDVDYALQAASGLLMTRENPGIPGFTSLVSFLSDFGTLPSIFLAPCDGVVAAEQNLFSYSDLLSNTSRSGFVQRTEHLANSVPGGCNSKPSHYFVNWTMNQLVLVPDVTTQALSYDVARQRLEAVGLRAQQLQEYPNRPGDMVLRQSVKANTPDAIGATVELTTGPAR